MKKKNMFQGLLLLWITLAICGCGFNADKKDHDDKSANAEDEENPTEDEHEKKIIPWNQNAVINDLSYPMWYLSRALEVTDYEAWNVYELESDEMSIALFQNNLAEPAGSGSYYLFGYGQIGDNPLAYACILEGNAVLVDTTSDGLSLYKLTLTSKWDDDDYFSSYFGEDAMYVLCDQNGMIKRFMGDLRGFMSYEFVYNDAGQIETLYCANGNTNWETLSSFISESLDFDQCGRFMYDYNENGMLENVYTCNWWAADDTDHLTYEFEYDESGRRKKMTDCFQYSCDYIEFYRGNKELTTEKVVYGNDSDIMNYIIEYLDDGTFAVKNADY